MLAFPLLLDRHIHLPHEISFGGVKLRLEWRLFLSFEPEQVKLELMLFRFCELARLVWTLFLSFEQEVKLACRPLAFFELAERVPILGLVHFAAVEVASPLPQVAGR